MLRLAFALHVRLSEMRCKRLSSSSVEAPRLYDQQAQRLILTIQKYLRDTRAYRTQPRHHSSTVVCRQLRIGFGDFIPFLLMLPSYFGNVSHLAIHRLS